MYQKHARAFMRTLAEPGEVWRILANPQHHIHGTFLTLTRVPAKGPPHSPEFWRRCLVCGGRSECAQFDKASVLSPGCLVLTVGEVSFFGMP